MKFVKEYAGANLSIPSAALEVSHFEKETVELTRWRTRWSFSRAG